MNEITQSSDTVQAIVERVQPRFTWFDALIIIIIITVIVILIHRRRKNKWKKENTLSLH